MEQHMTNPVNDSVESLDENSLDNENEKLKLELEQRERELNERELRADFNANILADLKNLNIEDSKELKDSLIKIIDFTDKDSFNDSYDNAIQILKNVKLVTKNGHYIPRVGNGGNRNDLIKDAFKPLKLY